MSTPTPSTTPTPGSTPAEQAGANRRWRRPAVLVPLAVGAAVLLAVGLVVFQPWRLFVDEVVDEALPGAAVSTAPSAPATAGPAPSPSASGSASASAAGPVELARGTLVAHEHPTSGTVLLLELADGTRVIRFEGLDTDSGPDLRVWLSDQPVVEGVAGWKVFDDGEYVDLGGLKGNKGNQNYVVPAGVDLDTLTSVAIWCARFSVSFGAATLEPA